MISRHVATVDKIADKIAAQNCSTLERDGKIVVHYASGAGDLRFNSPCQIEN